MVHMPELTPVWALPRQARVDKHQSKYACVCHRLRKGNLVIFKSLGTSQSCKNPESHKGSKFWNFTQVIMFLNLESSNISEAHRSLVSQSSKVLGSHNCLRF